MTATPPPADPVEPDQTLAPLVGLYTLAVVGWLAAVLLWVFWFRGYA